MTGRWRPLSHRARLWPQAVATGRAVERAARGHALAAPAGIMSAICIAGIAGPTHGSAPGECVSSWHHLDEHLSRLAGDSARAHARSFARAAKTKPIHYSALLFNKQLSWQIVCLPRAMKIRPWRRPTKAEIQYIDRISRLGRSCAGRQPDGLALGWTDGRRTC